MNFRCLRTEFGQHFCGVSALYWNPDNRNFNDNDNLASRASLGSLFRTKTKKRMFKKILAQFNNLESKAIDRKKFDQTLQSYLGVLKHANSFKLKQKLAIL